MNTKYNFYSTLGAALLLLSLTASAESKPIASAEKKEKKETHKWISGPIVSPDTSLAVCV